MSQYARRRQNQLSIQISLIFSYNVCVSVIRVLSEFQVSDWLFHHELRQTDYFCMSRIGKYSCNIETKIVILMIFIEKNESLCTTISEIIFQIFLDTLHWKITSLMGYVFSLFENNNFINELSRK